MANVNLDDVFGDQTDNEARMQEHESKAGTRARHLAFKGTLPDELFAGPKYTGIRQTWTQIMMQQMVKHPGVWFNKVYEHESAEVARKRTPSSTAAMFVGGSNSPPHKRNKMQREFLEQNGGKFEAQYTREPLAPEHEYNSTGKWIQILRVRWMPPRG